MSATAATVTIRSAARSDVSEIVRLIGELSDYEKLRAICRASEERLAEHLFGPSPRAEVLLAELDGAVIGFALFFHNFSTFACEPGIYLEDLFVRPEHRGRGAGALLLRCLAGIAVDRGCARFEWAVLDWNTTAIDFYRRAGAKLMDEWTIMRMEGDALRDLAPKDNH